MMPLTVVVPRCLFAPALTSDGRTLTSTRRMPVHFGLEHFLLPSSSCGRQVSDLAVGLALRGPLHARRTSSTRLSATHSANVLSRR